MSKGSEDSETLPKENYPKVGYAKLFRYADSKDIALLIFGLICAAAVGVAVPGNILIFRSVVNSFTQPVLVVDQIYSSVKWFAVLGAGMLVVAFLQAICMNLSSDRQIRRIRLLYFKSILRQDIPWYDCQSSGALISTLSQNIQNIEMGIGPKLGEFVQYISGFIAGIVIGFTVGWKLSLVACAMLPLVVAVFGLFGFIIKIFTVKELAAYARAGSIAGEVLSAIRTVVAFGGEKKEVQRYTNELESAEIVGIKKATAVGGVGGAIGLMIFSSAALIFWYGVKLIIEEKYDPGSVVTVFINILLGSIFLGNALPNFQYFMNAQGSAREVYGTIERIPQIQKDYEGTILPEFHGNVVFKNIKFVYPTRPNITVLENFNFNLKSGQTVALVGPSGSGKSTIVQMLQRFYDPVEGDILVEGVDIRDLNLKAFRNQIGCVLQEPMLFEGTIAENIRMGKIDATQDEIEEAAKLANAHDFIQQLPEAYETFVAERGSGMSGGQKQRIAIARALIRKPKLLLLDEATSALDTRSEKIVQEALDKACKDRTVVIVAHRLTTVRNADLIIVLNKGSVCETGTHEELIQKGGLYATMLHNQKISETTELSDGEKEEAESSGNIVNQHNARSRNSGVWMAGDSDDIISTSTGTIVCESHRKSSFSVALRSRFRKLKHSPTARVLRLNRPELPYIIGGCFCSLIAGGVQPGFAILYSEMFEIFKLIYDPTLMQRRVNLISGMMALLGFLRFFAYLGQGYLFGKAGEKLTRRIRSLCFEKILEQEIGWFDEPANQAGSLTAKLATDASKISGVAGSQLGFLVEAFVLVLVSLLVAFVYSWQLTLLVIVFFPILVIGGILQMRSMSGKSKTSSDTKSMSIAQEAIISDRTVSALTLEDFFYERFKSSLGDNRKMRIKSNLIFAVMYALSQSVTMFAFAAAFSLGAYLVSTGKIEMLAVFRVFASINMGAQSLGRSATLGLDSKKATIAAKSILAILDRRTKIPTEQGQIPDKPFNGKVHFHKVYFRYPTRYEKKILKNFSHTINPGETVALVGQSGCGKSTLLQLVQRFYDPSDHGPMTGVFFDDMNIRELAPCWVRQQIGIVSQEPNLFDLSLRENIAYGDNTREVPMEEIIEAARAANIHDFIATLPDGYETIAGQRGSKLSGGQKQRVAIARALVRKPILLLLDEATSALDNESERIVQNALDAAIGSRTSLVVAHRLTTVENADLVVVLQDGHKIEAGTPAALLNAKGAFYALHHTEKY